MDRRRTLASQRPWFCEMQPAPPGLARRAGCKNRPQRPLEREIRFRLALHVHRVGVWKRTRVQCPTQHHRYEVIHEQRSPQPLENESPRITSARMRTPGFPKCRIFCVSESRLSAERSEEKKKGPKGIWSRVLQQRCRVRRRSG